MTYTTKTINSGNTILIIKDGVTVRPISGEAVATFNEWVDKYGLDHACYHWDWANIYRNA